MTATVGLFIFDIGWGELVVIGVVALIAIGPKELPTVLRTLGQYMGKIKRMSAEFQSQFQEAMREAELSDLKQHATDLGLDAQAFGACLDSGKHADEIKKSVEEGQRYGLSGTPSFFINGRLIVGAQPYDSFAQVIDEELARTPAAPTATAAAASGKKSEP